MINNKLLLALNCTLASCLLVVQLAPLARAQSGGNMSDGTGSMPGNLPGNMSDATGGLITSDVTKLILLLREGKLSIRGVTLSRELQVQLLALLNGDQQGLGQIISVLVRSGISGSEAQDLASSLRGLFLANGTIDQAQFTRLVIAYRAIANSVRLRFDFLGNPPTEFLAIQALLAQLGVDISIPIANMPYGNISDITGGIIQVGGTQQQSESVAIVQSQVTITETGEISTQIVGSTSQSGGGQTQTQQGTPTNTGNKPSNGKPNNPAPGNMSDATGGLIVSAPTKPTTPTAPTAPQAGSQTGAPTPQTGAPQTANSQTGNQQNNGSAGAAVANGPIVTTSDIVGGVFAFVSVKIKMSILQSANLVCAKLKEKKSLVFAGKSISVEAQQKVLALLTTKNGAGIGPVVSSLASAGVPGNYAEALATTVQGLITVNGKGEATEVNPTKLVTSVGVYNATIDASNAQTLTSSGELRAIGFSLGQIVDAASAADGGSAPAAPAPTQAPAAQ